MTVSTIHPDRLIDGSRVVPISVDQYDRMVETGILPEGAPIELIDGMLVRKDRSKAGEQIVTVGREHVWSVKAVGRTDERLRPLGYHMQTQSPVIVSAYGEPEPDGAILIGSADDYLQRKPAASDAVCVIEVADSSLNFDRTTKLQNYAEAGIQQYVIVNLVHDRIEEFSSPVPAEFRYARSQTLHAGESLLLMLKDDQRLAIAVGDWLLPKR